MLVDLSHDITAGMVTYPGVPGPVICDFMSREDSLSHYTGGTSFQISKVDLVANTGTYLDVPFHRFAGTPDLGSMPLASLASLDAVLVRANGRQAVGVDELENVDVEGKALLVHTGWSTHWGTEKYLSGHSFLTEAAALHLKEKGVRLVGIDSLNIDSMADGSRPVHTILLAAGIPLVEHLCNLESIPDQTPFFFTAAPPKFHGVGTFPVRAFAQVVTK